MQFSLFPPYFVYQEEPALYQALYYRLGFFERALIMKTNYLCQNPIRPHCYERRICKVRVDITADVPNTALVPDVVNSVRDARNVKPHGVIGVRVVFEGPKFFAHVLDRGSKWGKRPPRFVLENASDYFAELCPVKLRRFVFSQVEVLLDFPI